MITAHDIKKSQMEPLWHTQNQDLIPAGTAGISADIKYLNDAWVVVLTPSPFNEPFWSLKKQMGLYKW